MDLFAGFDHYAMQIGEDGTPYRYFEQLRDQAIAAGKSMGWSETHGGFWVVVRWDTSRRIHEDISAFSNVAVTFPRYATPGGKPFMLSGQDEPEHKHYRRMVQAPFTRPSANAMSDQIRDIVNELIDTIIDLGQVDVCTATDLLPERAAAAVLGLPLADAPKYRRFVQAIVEGATDPEAAAPHIRDMEEYWTSIVAARRARPEPGLLSQIINAEYEGVGLNDEELLDFFTVLILGGLDNTARFLGNAFYRLARDAELRRALAHNPELVPSAVEEFFRLDGPASIFREVVKPVEIDGVRLEPGQIVGLIHPITNRDPAQFVDPDRFVPDRSPNRHFAFGIGIHHCLGVHLARVESIVLIREFLRRIPEFELDPERKPRWVSGQVGAMHNVPIVFKPGGGR